MADPFVAEIRIFAGNFAPAGWAMCNGQILPISQNTALFSLLGTTYGGNGTTTFALPNLQGRVPIHVGGAQPGPGLSVYSLGQTGGETTHTLLAGEVGAHAHTLKARPVAAGAPTPTPTTSLAEPSPNSNQLYVTSPFGATVALNTQSVALSSGGGQPHNNLQPYLVLNYIIALQGVFPPRG